MQKALGFASHPFERFAIVVEQLFKDVVSTDVAMF